MRIFAIVLVIHLLVIYNIGLAQTDSIQVSDKFSISLETRLLTLPPFSKGTVRTDPVIQNSREFFIEEVTDNPFHHLGAYASGNITYQLSAGSSVTVRSIVEQRGWSYGIHMKENLVFIPEFYFNINDSIRFRNSTIKTMFNVGNNIPTGLSSDPILYNTDYIGVFFSATDDRNTLSFLGMGDMAWGISNNIEELLRIVYSRSMYWGKDFKIIPFINLDMINAYFLDALPQTMHYGILRIGSEIYYKSGAKIAASIDFADPLNQSKREGKAFTIEYLKAFSLNNFSFKINPRFRFYSRAYNENHFLLSVNYRKDGIIKDGNSVGKYVYPLRNYYREVSQWGLYTEYQNQDIFGSELVIKCNWSPTKSTYSNLHIEDIFLTKNKDISNSFNYFFFTYEAGVRYKSNLQCGITVTNKAMNLDTHYHTFYQRKIPYLGLHLFFSTP